MRPPLAILPALSLSLVLGCGGAPRSAPATTPASPPAPAQAARTGLQIQLATIYVDDQDKALRFYTDVLGFTKKDDVTNGPYRWLTVTATPDGSGPALLLALNDNPAAKAFQQAMFAQQQPAAMFMTDDIQREYARLQARGAELGGPPTEVMADTYILTLEDTCGNLVQLTQLGR